MIDAEEVNLSKEEENKLTLLVNGKKDEVQAL